jgi:hypothetical protein
LAQYLAFVTPRKRGNFVGEKSLVIGTRRYSRLAFAVATCVVGGIVSFVMVYWGGPNARHLPDGTFHLGAFFGAAAAGWICMGCFGRPKWKGWVIALLGGVAMTFFGALIGATIINESRFFMRGAELGVFAIFDAAESPFVMTVWGLGMTALHLFAVKLRARGPIPWKGPRD